MSTRKPRKPAPRKAAARPARKKGAVHNVVIDTRDSIAAPDGAVSPPRRDPYLTGDWRPRQDASIEDIDVATRMAVQLGMKFDDAMGRVRQERYGESNRQVLDQLAASAAAAGCFGRSVSVSGDLGGEAPVGSSRKAQRADLPAYVFDLRQQLDTAHRVLRDLIWTLEPVLTVGPDASGLQRTARPVSEKPLDHSDPRDAELTCSLDSIDAGLGDLHVILANLVAYLALPFQADPNNMPPSVTGASTRG